MEANTMSVRARLRIASVGAGFLAVFVLAYGNQGLESWRLSRWQGGSLWLRPYFSALNQVAWRFTSPSREQAARIWPGLGVNDPTRAWIGAAVRDVAIVVLAWLLLYAVGRGISATRGRVPVFLGTLGCVVFAVAAVYVAVVPLQFAAPFGGNGAALAYYQELSAGLVAGLLTGLITALLTVLTYRRPKPVAGPADPDVPDQTDPAETFPAEADPVAATQA